MTYKIKGERKRKPGGGRKPKAATILKRLVVQNKIEEAEASFAFMVSIRESSVCPIGLRAEAAKWIHEAVYGRPKQPIGNDDKGELVFRVIYGTDDKDAAGAPKTT